MSIFILPIIIWWIYYLLRLLNHSQDEQFLKLPWLYLWVAAYNFGWCYTLNHFFVLEKLESSIFASTSFPLASFIWVSLCLFHELGFLWIVQGYKSKPISIACFVIAATFAVVIFTHFLEIPYTTLYRIDVILIYVSSSVAVVVLFFIMRKQIHFPARYIEFAHLLWFTILCLLSAMGLNVMLVNALSGLMHNELIVETPLQEIAYLFNMLAMISLMILAGPDTVIYHSIYPYRMWQYRKLLKLEDYILSHIEITPIIATLNSKDTPNIEIAIHETLIKILDYYPYLVDHEVFQNDLEAIEASSQDLETILFKMTRLPIPSRMI